MSGVTHRCRNCAHECAAGDSECPVCCGTPGLWCRRCGQWLESDRCADCAKRDASPRAAPPPPAARRPRARRAANVWYALRERTTCGPYTIEELRRLAVSGALAPSDDVWQADDARVRTVSDLFPDLSASAPPLDPPPAAPPEAEAGVLPGECETAALGAVTGPARGLLLTGFAGAAVCTFSSLESLLGPAKNAGAAHGLGVLATMLALVALNGFICFAAWQMLNLRGFRVAVAASVLAMLPCSGCCYAGLPVGIWSLAVLMRPEVKSFFRD